MRPAQRIHPRADRPLYQQVADDLRQLIQAGTLRSGAPLPGESDLADDYDVSTNTIRGALAVLRNEGLIVTERAKGSRVRTPQEPLVVTLPPAGRAVIRAATDTERIRLDLPAGALVVEIQDESGIRVVPALGVVIHGSDAAS